MNQTGLYLLLLASLAIGFSLASQAGVNAQLRLALHSPVQASFISFLLGTLILGVVALAEGKPWFREGGLSTIPWWAWLGGAFGAFNIAVSVYLAPKLGALVLAVSVVCGQVMASLLYDQQGWVGYPKIELNSQRLLGALLIVAGVEEIKR